LPDFEAAVAGWLACLSDLRPSDVRAGETVRLQTCRDQIRWMLTRQRRGWRDSTRIGSGACVLALAMQVRSRCCYECHCAARARVGGATE
jgi:hypothetical protein